MDKRTKEIRKLLRSRIAVDQETGLIIAAPNVLRVRSGGYHRGADSVRWLGIRIYRQEYRVKGNVDKGKMQAVKALLSYGRQAFLQSSPGTLAVLRRPTVLAPSLLTLDELGKDHLLLSVYLPRTILSTFNVKKILKNWGLDKPMVLEEVETTEGIRDIDLVADPVKESEE